MPSHPLDRPIWAALTTRQAAFGSDGALARRLREDIGPFAAAIGGSAEAIAALGGLAHADDDMSLLERSPPLAPAGVTVKMSAAGVQMVATAVRPAGRGVSFEALSDADVPDMIALATLTKPGPFRAATHTLGRFIGVRENGLLIAMAGERMQTDDFIEVSGICTRPEHRGHGLAAALTAVVTDRILREGRTPFLHAYAANTDAISVYRKLGFEHRCDVTHAVWSRDPV